MPPKVSAFGVSGPSKASKSPAKTSKSPKSPQKKPRASSKDTKGKGKEDKEKEEICFKFVTIGRRSDYPDEVGYSDLCVRVTGRALQKRYYEPTSVMGHEELCRCEVQWFNRDEFRRGFQAELQSQRHTDKFFCDVFDRCGYLRSRHYEDEHMKGTGIWDESLGHGSFLYISKWAVSPDLEGMSTNTDCQIEKDLLLGTIAAAANQTDLGAKYVFTDLEPKPTIWSPEDRDNETKKKEMVKDMKRMHAIYTGVGFRRIGLTDYYCYAIGPEHPSHALPAEEFDEDTFNKSWITKTTPYQFPPNVRRVLKTMGLQSRTTLFEYLKGETKDHPLPADFDFLAQDDDGDTLLHNAVLSFPSVIKFLIEKAPKALHMRNRYGETPFDHFKDEVYQNVCAFERLRQVSSRLRNSGKALAEAMGASKEELDNFMTQYRYGCESGKCIGGLVSHRSIYDLGVGAERAANDIRRAMSAPDTSFSGPRGFLKVMTLQFLPLPLRIRPVASKAFFLEFARLLEELATVLFSGRLATEEDARKISPLYFSRGGQLKFVYATILSAAHKFLEWVLHDGPSDPPMAGAPATTLLLEDEMFGVFRQRYEARTKLPRCGVCDNDMLRVRLHLFGFDAWGSVKLVGPFTAGMV